MIIRLKIVMIISIIIYLFSCIDNTNNNNKVKSSKENFHSFVQNTEESNFINVPQEPVYKITSRELKCLAENMYHEARGEGVVGMALVGQVTIVRTASDKYPSDICKVVYQKAQFSWTLSKEKKIPEKVIDEYLKIAYSFFIGEIEVPKQFKQATHYYSTAIKEPYWANKMTYLGQNGNHKFFKDPKIVAEK
jgi:N-acetylmuramoyl-L-alanine amidase